MVTASALQKIWEAYFGKLKGDRLASHKDVLRGLRGAGERDGPLRKSVWETRYIYHLGLSLHIEHFWPL